MKDFIPENFRTPRKSRFKFVFRMFSETRLFDCEFINSKYKDISRNTQISSKLQASEDKPERS